MSIRQLKPGEKLPPGEPRRYRAGHGYIRLRLEKRLDALGLPRFPYGPTPRHLKGADIHANPEQARQDGWLTFRRDLGGAA